MEELVNKAFDFSIRSIELANYLDDEKLLFPMKMRLVECAEGICVCLRTANNLPQNAQEYCVQAYRLSIEAECLLELMVKTGILSEKQSGPILTDCRYLKIQTEKQLSITPGKNRKGGIK